MFVFSVIVMRDERSIGIKVKAKYRSNAPAATPAPIGPREQLKDQIANEINERVDFLQDMRGVGSKVCS